MNKSQNQNVFSNFFTTEGEVNFGQAVIDLYSARPHLLGRALIWPGHFGAFWITSYFEKGCRKKCTRQSRKALWVVLSSLCFSKKFERIDTKGHGNVFASAKVHSTATVVRNRVLIITHVTFRDYREHIFFRQPFSK